MEVKIYIPFLSFPNSRAGFGTFHYDGCQGFTGPDPSAFLDNAILKEQYFFRWIEDRKKLMSMQGKFNFAKTL